MLVVLALAASALYGGGPGGLGAVRAGRASASRARPLASSHEPSAGPGPSDPSMPPSKLADAWTAAETVTKLAEKLKGCSLHVIGRRNGATSSAALALARRLKESRYRFLDLDAVVQQLLAAKAGADGGADAAKPSEEELREVEHAVLEEAKAWTRSVLFVAGDVASQSSNWAALHQGIVVLVSAAPPPGVAGAAEEAPDELWMEQADVQVTLDAEVRG